MKSNKNPWKRTLTSIKYRCFNSKCHAYKHYGGRGIKCLITADDLKSLWFRDKAMNMKMPSIDRIDNNGHYDIQNCRYIEQAANAARRKGDGKHARKFKESYKCTDCGRTDRKNIAFIKGRCHACHNRFKTSPLKPFKHQHNYNRCSEHWDDCGFLTCYKRKCQKLANTCKCGKVNPGNKSHKKGKY